MTKIFAPTNVSDRQCVPVFGRFFKHRFPLIYSASASGRSGPRAQPAHLLEGFDDESVG